MVNGAGLARAAMRKPNEPGVAFHGPVLIAGDLIVHVHKGKKPCKDVAGEAAKDQNTARDDKKAATEDQDVHVAEHAPSAPPAPQPLACAPRGGGVPVTLANARRGLRVRRGRDWKWGNQDGGVGALGTLMGPAPRVGDGMWRVRWDHGLATCYSLLEEEVGLQLEVADDE